MHREVVTTETASPSPLALAMVGGLLNSTLFALRALPAFYALADGLAGRAAEDEVRRAPFAAGEPKGSRL